MDSTLPKIMEQIMLDNIATDVTMPAIISSSDLITLDNSDIPAPDTPLLVPENIETDTTEKSSAFFVYLLLNKTGKCTYVGATIDLNHRLRQHNGEIKGGAKYTTGKGKDQWTRVAHVYNIPSWKDALRFEWRWKQLSRKHRRKANESPVEHRLRALRILMSLDRATAAATPYNEWPHSPALIIE